MRGFSFSLSFNPLRRLPCLLSAETPQPYFCVRDTPHPGSPPVFLCTFPQSFFIECSALPSPAPLFPKLALPIKSLIKKPPCRATADTLSCIRIRPANPSPFLFLWPCRFRSALFFAIFLLFFSPGRFFMRPGPRPAFCTVCCARVFRAVGAARFSAFFPLFWLWFRCFFVRILHRR